MFSKILKYIKNNKIFSSFLIISFIIFIFFGLYIATELFRQNERIDDPIKISNSELFPSKEEEKTIKSENLFLSCEIVDYSYEKFKQNGKSYTWYEVQSYDLPESSTEAIFVFNKSNDNCIVSQILGIPEIISSDPIFNDTNPEKYAISSMISSHDNIYFIINHEWLFNYNLESKKTSFLLDIHKEIFADYKFKQVFANLEFIEMITRWDQEKQVVEESGFMYRLDHCDCGACEGGVNLEQTAEVIKIKEQCNKEFDEDVSQIERNLGIWYYDIETKTSTKILDLK